MIRVNTLSIGDKNLTLSWCHVLCLHVTKVLCTTLWVVRIGRVVEQSGDFCDKSFIQRTSAFIPRLNAGL